MLYAYVRLLTEGFVVDHRCSLHSFNVEQSSQGPYQLQLRMADCQLARLGQGGKRVAELVLQPHVHDIFAGGEELRVECD